RRGGGAVLPHHHPHALRLLDHRGHGRRLRDVRADPGGARQGPRGPLADVPHRRAVRRVLPARGDRGPAAVTEGAHGETEPVPAGEESAGGGENVELAADLQRVLLVSSRILRSHTASEEVSAPQFSVLAYLQRTGESTPGALAEFDHVSP